LQQRQQNTDSLTVVTTATLRINLDGTWEVIGFGKPKHVRHPHQRKLTNWQRKKRRTVGSLIDEEPEFKPASWYLENARKIRKKSGGPEGHSKHCKRCGMAGVNSRTCLTVIDMHGRMLMGRKHRKAGGAL
jgi:hypothetical protein